ncbi:MAG: VOC family protein [Burkholderiaceae bacterium]|nr:VOC family protein [Burkholderiaceae bacterium]MDO9089173.1 VOC family protein [Burkholderiaceae bacterium]
MLQGLHHVAYRCIDAARTVDFYTRVLELPFAHALVNDHVASTGEYSPHIHIFFEMADGSYIAFFELANALPAQQDAHTPSWVQHLALQVPDEAALLRGKERLLAHGVDVIGPTDHGFCLSIYFFDPSGHRLEMTVRTDTPRERSQFAAQADTVLQAWSQRKARGEIGRPRQEQGQTP